MVRSQACGIYDWNAGAQGWRERRDGALLSAARLLDTPERGGSGLNGGVRRYGEDDLRRLRFIRQAQGAGFTLEEIGELLTLDAGHDHARARQLAAVRIAALDAKIAELQSARSALEKLAHACAHSHGPCPILTAFEV